MLKPTPLSFLIENRKTVLEAYHGSERKPKKTWSDLQETLPEVSEVMSFNTFKQYVGVFAGVAYELDKVIQSLEKTNLHKLELQGEVEALKVQLDRVNQKTTTSSSVIQGLDKKPKRIAGWNVQRSKDGYYRCYRKIDNHVHAIYIGKALNIKKATERIAEKEKALGLYKG